MTSECGVPARVVFNDPRRFGFMLLTTAADLDAHPLLSGLGIEPTGNRLDASVLAQLMAGKAAPSWRPCSTNGWIAGLGNIYVCEALWRAGCRHCGPPAPLQEKRGAARPCAPSALRRRSGPSSRTGDSRQEARRCGITGRPTVARLLPAFLLGLRPGGRALPAQGVHWRCAADRAVRAVHFLLPRLSALGYPRPGTGREGRQWPRNHHLETRAAGSG